MSAGIRFFTISRSAFWRVFIIASKSFAEAAATGLSKFVSDSVDSQSDKSLPRTLFKFDFGSRKK